MENAKPSKNLDADIQQQVEALHLGTKIRNLRRHKRLTLQDVSKISGLSKSLLSQIENEVSAPPVATLVRIARALGVAIGYFFKETTATSKISLVRRDQGRVAIRGTQDARGKTGYAFQALAEPMLDQHMEPFLVEFLPRNKNDMVFYHHKGEEFLYVQEGTIEFQGADQVLKLNPGDSLYFDSSIPHTLRGLSNIPAKALVVVYAPE